MLFEVLLVLIEHAIEPWQQFLGAVIGMKDNRDFVCSSDGPDVVRAGDCTRDGSFLVLVCNTLYRLSIECEPRDMF